MTYRTDSRPLTRRYVLGGSLAIAGLAGLGRIAPTVAAPLPLTPAQGTGPFYPLELPADFDSDLVKVEGHAAQALGQIAHVGGRILTQDGTPIPGARVEIWQCDANGRYIHPGDNRSVPRDANFQGFGRTESAADGGYRFRTIMPVHYPGRTPHIHFAVWAPGGDSFVTQMYVEGEPRNEQDGQYRRVPAEARPLVTVAFRPAPEVEAEALAGSFDLVIA